MDNLNEAIFFGDILNENFGDAIKAGVQAAGANMKATRQVNKQNKEADKKAALQKAQGNLGAVNPIIEKLQPIANEKTQFDADTINWLLEEINKLNVDDNIKKQINQMLNQQKAALQQQEAAKVNPSVEEKKVVTDDPKVVAEEDNKTDTSGEGDPNKAAKDDTIVPAINRFIGNDGNNPRGSVDDLIAYLQDLKKQQQQS